MINQTCELFILFYVDSVSSSTVDETQKDHESREQVLQSDMESSKLPAFQSEPALAESQIRPADASVEDETPAPDQRIPNQRIPNKENCAKTTASDGEAGTAPNEFGHCTITVEADESGPKTTKLAPVILVLTLNSLFPSLARHLNNPSTSISDRFYSYNIEQTSMRIKKNMNSGFNSRSNTKFSELTSQEFYGRL